MYLYTCVSRIGIHTGYHFPVISFPHWHLSSVLLYITCILPVIWAYPNVNQHFSSKSKSECPSVCPVLFRLQHAETHWMPNCFSQGLVHLSWDQLDQTRALHYGTFLDTQKFALLVPYVHSLAMLNVRTSWIPVDRHQHTPIRQSTRVFQSVIGSMMRLMMILL